MQTKDIEVLDLLVFKMTSLLEFSPQIIFARLVHSSQKKAITYVATPGTYAVSQGLLHGRSVFREKTANFL